MTRASLYFPPISQFSSFSRSCCLSLSLVLSPSLSPVLSHPRHEITTIFVPFVPYGSPIAGSVRRAPIARERASRPGRVESQPDRLKCNWRAHYLVLSHRDNYPRGRFHQNPLSPLFRLKHDDVTRRAGSSLYEIFRFFFFQARQRARLHRGRHRRLAAYDGRQRDIPCAVLRSPIYMKHCLRVDEGLKARSLSFLFPLSLFPRCLCVSHSHDTLIIFIGVIYPRLARKMLESSVCATVPKTHKKFIVIEILFH